MFEDMIPAFIYGVKSCTEATQWQINKFIRKKINTHDGFTSHSHIYRYALAAITQCCITIAPCQL